VSQAAPPAASPYTAAPVKTVAQAIARLQNIESYIEEHEPNRARDGVACFNRVYLEITSKVGEGVASGFFTDVKFVTELDVDFVNRYLAALRASVRKPSSVPSSWKVLIESRSRPGIVSIQFATSGVNAHVNYDLPRALVATVRKFGTEPFAGSQRRDFVKLNEILIGAIQELRQSFESGAVKELDSGQVAKVLNVVGNWSVVEARDAAWVNAGLLFNLSKIGMASPFEVRLDRMVGLAGHLLLTPVI
jgi:hypothetical protein